MEHQYIFEATLPPNTKTYVRRNADGELYQKLIEGKFCYVFNARKMGKSSLAVRVMQELTEKAGVNCVYIDLSQSDTKLEKLDQWYANVLDTLVEELLLDVDLASWLEEREWLSPLGRFRKFIESVMLPQLEGEKVAIFIDEIDSVLSLNFPTDDFFAFIRGCYNNRAQKPAYNNLTFCLLGVATPSDLIADKKRTPFNIGTAIELTGFTFKEAKDVLTPGLAGKVDDPEEALNEVINWTGGQPFLTQKLCGLVANLAEGSSFDISQLVERYVINNWEGHDNPEHLRTIRDRIFRKEEKAGRLLGLYQQVLLRGEVPIDSSQEQMELRLSGLVVKRDEKLMVYNDIYRAVFDRDWVEKELEKLRPYSGAIALWEASGCEDESQLLRGQGLWDAREWAVGKSLSDLDYRFLAACQQLEQREVEEALAIKEKESEILAEANKEANQKIQKANRRVVISFAVLMMTLVGVVVAGIQLAKTKQELVSIKAEIKRRNEELIDSEVALIARNFTVLIEGESSASGTIVDSGGNIYTVLTTYHNLITESPEWYKQYRVKTYDEKYHEVYYGQQFPRTDLALLKFKSEKKYGVASLGNSQEVSQYQKIYLAGYIDKNKNALALEPNSGYHLVKATFVGLSSSFNGGYKLLFYSATLPQMSGGSILNSGGHMIGVSKILSKQNSDSVLPDRGIPIENLKQLPKIIGSTFYCSIDFDGTPITVKRTSRGDIPIIRWRTKYFSESGKPPQIRCEVVSAKFQKFYQNRKIQHLTTGNINGYPAICVVDSKLEDSCSSANVLFFLRREDDPNSVLQQLLSVANLGYGPLDL